MDSRRIMLVGGGTGGHFYPLMAIAESLVRESQARTVAPPRLYYIGPEPYDEAALAMYNIQYVHCAAGKRRRYFSLRNGIDIFKLGWGVLQALKKLFVIYPDVVMSKGGYTSVPVVIAARLLRIPVVVHESDAVPGSANKFAARFAQYIGIAYADTVQYFPAEKTVLVGVPIRSELRAGPATNAHALLGISADRPILLILGGSQGAERINQLILESLDELLPTYTVIHQTGEQAFTGVAAAAKTLIPDPGLLAHYHPFAFLDASSLNQAMHVATIIISRAGSGAIHEIAIHGKPSILIPIPEEISHDQRTNAYAYARAGAAVVMEEKNMHDGLLTAEIARMIGDERNYATYAQQARAFAPVNAADEMARVLIGIAEEH